MKNKWALVIFVVMLIAFGGAWFSAHRWANRARSTAPGGAPNSGTSALAHPALVPRSVAPSRVSPYAVVRNGICVPSNVSHQEAASRKKWESLLSDPFWQSIYSGVNPESFHLAKTSLPLHRYVTYRKMENGQLIHWTGRKIFIPAGTRVFADGRGAMYLCACGNQVAAVLPPKTPDTVLPPDEEPPVAYLVPPEPEPFPVSPQGLPGETPVVPPKEATTPPTPLGTPPILVRPSPSGGVPGLSLNPGAPSSKLPITPEPSTFSLTLTGFGVLILAAYLKR